MKIGIIGLGAIGGYIAIKLKLAGYDPFIFQKRVGYTNIPLQLIDDEKIYSQNLNVATRKTEVDILFIAVKSYDLINVLDEYKYQIDKAKHIVITQSNINLYKYNWAEYKDKIYLMPFFIGVLKDTNCILELSKGKLVLGKVNGSTLNTSNSVLKILSDISFVETSRQLEFDSFLKVTINSSLFPMCILKQCSFAKAHQDKESLIYATNIFYETIKIAQKKFRNKKLFIFEYELEIIDYNISFIIIKRIVEKYGKVLPSMLLDIIKQHETEITFFYHDIIDVAKIYNVDIPTLLDAKMKIQNILNK